ncbi:conjugated bile salt MFS transporter [uncultured Clostridium sp.]|uniref:conjugated bile salt MFS transporter n=1 Tax=uncultured Clostridium sp. TaxID=59620 RepID=UPI0026223AF0|nr:conjugated bile salt MFS transporter [uncultured Clostridium sp.]
MKSSQINLENSKGKYLNIKIIIGCMLIQAIPFSIASNIQPQFISYVTKGCNFSLTGFSLIFTIGTLVSALSSPFVGNLYTKVHPKILFIAGCLLSGIGFLSFGFARTLMEFYIISAIVQIGTLTFSAIGIPTIINTYFNEKTKGSALSLAFAGGSIGNIVLQEVVVYLLTMKGFRLTYVVFGLISTITSVLFTLIFLDFKKLDKKNLISEQRSINPNVEHKTTMEKIPAREMFKSKTFIFFSIGFIFMGLAMAALSIQYPNYLRHLMKTVTSYKDVSLTFLGNIGALFAIFSLIGNLVGGILFDKIGTTKTLIIAFILTALSNIALILSIFSPIFAYIFAITKGLSVYSYMMGPSYLSSYFFKGKNFSKILSLINFMFAIGFSIGSTLFAIVSSNLGFVTSWILILVFVTISFILLLFANSSCKQNHIILNPTI